MITMKESQHVQFVVQGSNMVKFLSKPMTQEECVGLTKQMESMGWKCDINNEKKIGFIMPVDEKTEWFRDYNKETATFVQGNAKQIINIKVSSEKNR